MSSQRIERPKRQLAELERRWPAHSAPPPMPQWLDELERELRKAAQETDRAKANGRSGLS
jgi:hypothetical protein